MDSLSDGFQRLRRQIACSSVMPSWATDIAKVPEEWSKRATVEVKPVSPSYLVFLQEQIDLCPRGPEWNQLLQERLRSLQPFVNQELLNVTIRSESGGVLYLHASMDGKDVVHWEVR